MFSFALGGLYLIMILAMRGMLFLLTPCLVSEIRKLGAGVEKAQYSLVAGQLAYLLYAEGSRVR